jgi:hypothetical protein
MRERPPVCSECHNGVESVARLFARSHIMCYEQYQSKESNEKKTREKEREKEKKKKKIDE